MLQKLISLNDIFAQNESFGDEKNPDVFSCFEKKTFVCLCAPHATKTFVCKKIKQADLYTGAIVSYLSEFQNFTSIVRNKFVKRKALISDFIEFKHLNNHFFLDIHGMKNNDRFDLAIGTGYFQKEDYHQILQIIDALTKKYHISYVVNDEHYTGKFGLTGRLQKLEKKPCVLQLEFSKKYRDFFECADNVCNVTIPFISELSTSIEKLGTF